MVSYNTETLFAQIINAMRTAPSVSDGYRLIVDHCRTRHPHPDWDRLAALDPQTDITHLERWFRTLLIDEPPPAGIDGLWFGLFNPIDADGQTTADIYAAGGIYDAEDPDWNIDPQWWPEGRYARSTMLARIYDIAYDEAGGLGNDAEYALCLAYAALLVRHLGQVTVPDILVGGADRRVLVTGFDSGDFIHIGMATGNGLKLSRDGLQPNA